MQINIVRDYKSKLAILGKLQILSDDGVILFSCYTLEPPKKPKFGCIAPGHYPCFRSFSRKFQRHMFYLSVPGRSGIMFHVGNEPDDTKGCILLGNDRWIPPFLYGSTVTCKEFNDILFNSTSAIICYIKEEF